MLPYVFRDSPIVPYFPATAIDGGFELFISAKASKPTRGIQIRRGEAMLAVTHTSIHKYTQRVEITAIHV